MTASDLKTLAAAQPATAPRAQLLLTAAVTVSGHQDLGRSPGGDRFIIPITGGLFWGAEGFEALRGQVLAGGADRQLLRPDGIKELDALYELQCDDGTVITVRNRVLIDESESPRYARSTIKLTAPEGPHAALNRRVIVGTLQTLRPQVEAVLVRMWLLD